MIYFKNSRLIDQKINFRYYLNYHGPHTHIISITGRCNGKCVYCITNSPGSYNMNLNTGKKIIDFIFTIPLAYYYVEFTGGEPFLNYETLKNIIEYAKDKSRKFNKKIHFSIVSNLFELKEEYIKLILKHKITICSSLDGNSYIHNLSRGNYDKVIENLKKIIYYAKKGVIEYPNLITTLTSKSLKYPYEIVNEYLNLGIMRIQLGFLEPIGRAKENWDKIGYGYKEYLEFYKKAVDYIININLRYNIPVYEKGIYLLLYDIIKSQKPQQRSVDIFHRLAYDVNGNIYPSDETRIIGESGDKFFCLGNVFSTGFIELLKKKKAKNFMIENFQELTREDCARCEYAYYCRIPIYYNYITQNSYYGNMRTNERCKLFKGIFNLINFYLKDKNIKRVFNNWIKRYSGDV